MAPRLASHWRPLNFDWAISQYLSRFRQFTVNFGFALRNSKVRDANKLCPFFAIILCIFFEFCAIIIIDGDGSMTRENPTRFWVSINFLQNLPATLVLEWCSSFCKRHFGILVNILENFFKKEFQLTIFFCWEFAKFIRCLVT